jgi:hypothetical protein
MNVMRSSLFFVAMVAAATAASVGTRPRANA